MKKKVSFAINNDATDFYSLDLLKKKFEFKARNCEN